MKFKRISYHSINIRHTANGGCIAKVGCGEFSFSKPEDMLEALTQFYSDPKKMEKEYNSEYGPQPDMTDPSDEDQPQTERPIMSDDCQEEATQQSPNRPLTRAIREEY